MISKENRALKIGVINEEVVPAYNETIAPRQQITPQFIGEVVSSHK
jgi:hypothetical protein